MRELQAPEMLHKKPLSCSTEQEHNWNRERGREGASR